MATTIAKLNVLLTGGIDGFTGAMNSAGVSLAGFSTKVGGLGGIAASAGLAVAGIAAAAVAGAGALAGWGIKLASDAEQAQVAFTTMLGSADKAKELMTQIGSFAAATPFETTELVDASKKLLAFGVAQDQIIPSMRVLGDLASGLGIPLGELSEIYGKARVQGRLFMEDINQLTGRGIPVIQEFAKQFGVTESEVRGLVESGQIGFPQLQKALAAMTGEGGKFGGMMEAQSKTLAGMMSTLSDTIKMNLARVGAALIENLDLKGLIEGVATAISIVGNATVAIVEKLTKSLGDAGFTGSNAAKLILGGMEMLARGIGYAMNVLDGFKIVIKSLQLAFAWLFEKALQGTKLLAEGLAGVLNKTIDGVNWIIKKANELTGSNFGTIDLAFGVDSSIDTFIQGQKDLVSELIDEIQELGKFDNDDKAVAFFRKLKEAAEGAASATGKIDPLKIEEAAAAPEKAKAKAASKLSQPKNFFGEKTAAFERVFTAGLTQEMAGHDRPWDKVIAEQKKTTKATEKVAKNTAKFKYDEGELVEIAV